MTTPDITSFVPLKYKAVVGLVGSLLSFAVPLIVSIEQYLPSPWPAVIGAVLSVLTALGIYHAPYVPAEAVVVQKAGLPPAEGEYRNQWK